MQTIRYIQQINIDKQQWDQCINQSANGLIYAYSWYLDAMSDHWDALVLNDYEAVMPITWNKKYGVYYLFQPFFCASLGVFSKTKLNPEMVAAFLQKIPTKFKYFDIYLNQQNLYSIQGFPFTERVNYVLDLQQDYNTISSAYRSNLKRNIKKAETSGLIVKNDIHVDEILLLAKDTMQRVSSINEEEISRFKLVIEAAKKHTRTSTIGIYSAKQELLASALFLYSHHRWYYILVGNHPNGKTLGASHYLIDRFISQHAGLPDLLDFEGSDIRNLAFFYSSYGATEERYPALRLNRLPKILSWMKD